MRYIKSIAFASLVLFSSCQNDILVVDIDEQEPVRTFTAGTESYGTKTYSDEEGNILWNAGDLISIFEASTVNEQYQVKDESAGSTSAELELVDSGDPGSGEPLDANIAYYPYSASVAVQTAVDGFDLAVDLPQTQQYVEGTFGNGSFPMVAVTSDADDRNLKFKNVLGCLKLQLTGTAAIASISVRGNSDEILYGPAVVTGSSSTTPVIALSDSDAKTVTLDCGPSGVQLNKATPTVFVLALPPVTMANGFSIVITDIYGGQMEKTTTRAQVIQRSGILKMPAFRYINAEAVDLGLSVKWSSLNMGANRPGEEGDYFAWGETKAYGEDYPENLHNAIWEGTVKTHYSIYTYIFSEGIEREECEKNITKYNGEDGKTVLDPEDDAAVQVWGDGWRMPTFREMHELYSCEWRKCWYPYPYYDREVGIGYEVVGRNGNTIFFPFTASRGGYNIEGEGHGRYWTNELEVYSQIYMYNFPLHAMILNFNSTEVAMVGMDRRYGNCIRPVKDY